MHIIECSEDVSDDVDHKKKKRQRDALPLWPNINVCRFISQSVSSLVPVSL